MVVNKRKKNTRQRAGTTHGYGSMKKNRGAGHRGGRGRAGSGKRGDVKKPSLGWTKGVKHKGKIGFKTYGREKINAINLSLLGERAEGLVFNKLATKSGDTIKIDLKDIKCNKLLGSGKATYKYEIVVKYASEKAVKKVEAAGGKVILPSAEPKAESKKESKKESKAEKPKAKKAKEDKPKGKAKEEPVSKQEEVAPESQG